MRRSKDLNRPFLLVSALLLVVGAAATASAQKETEPLSIDQILRERISVEVVNIDVVVTDRDGRPVSGLGREDFEVQVDGEPVELSNFYAVESGTTRSGTTSPPPPPRREADSSAPGGDGAAVEPGDLHVVAYLDADQMGPQGLKRVLRQIRGFLEGQVEDGSRVMLITKHVGQNSVHGFLDDAKQVRAALKEIEGLPIAGARRGFERTFALEQIREHYETCSQQGTLGGGSLDPCEFCYNEMRAIADSYSRSRLNSRRVSTLALSRLVGGLATIPDRKALLYVSDGIDLQPGAEVYDFLDQMCSARSFGSTQYSTLRSQVPDMDDFNRVISLANANRVTFYGLEASGLEGSARSSVESGDLEYTLRAGHEMTAAANLESSLTMLSIDTGGRAILSSNQLDRDLVEVDRELGHFYSLGVSLDHPAKNETHRVRVRVPGHAGEVRYRKSFLHQETEQDLAEKTLGAVLFGVEANPLGVRVDPGSNAVLEGGLTRIGFDVQVPVERLTLLADGDQRRGRLTWLVVAPGAAGGRPVFRRKQVEVQVPATAPENGLYRLGVFIDLPPGGHLVGMGLMDELGDVTSVLGLEVNVPEPGSASGSAGR